MSPSNRLCLKESPHNLTKQKIKEKKPQKSKFPSFKVNCEKFRIKKKYGFNWEIK